MEWLASLLVKTGIAAFGESFFKPYLAHLDNRDAQAATLAAREMAVQEREIEAQKAIRIAEIGHPFEPDKIMGYIACAWLFVLVVWDSILGQGSHNPLHGWADSTLTAIVYAYFGKRGFENVARIWKR